MKTIEYSTKNKNMGGDKSLLKSNGISERYYLISLGGLV
jgi:hypothetical protein